MHVRLQGAASRCCGTPPGPRTCAKLGNTQVCQLLEGDNADFAK